jgi:glycine/D-amino acid oxidase-like deaminating enzyme
MNQTTHPILADSHTDKAYWLDAYGLYTPNAPLNGEITVDVAIVVGGYTGLGTAYFLRQAAPAMRVAVLEGEVVGYGASGRNGGFATNAYSHLLPELRRKQVPAFTHMVITEPLTAAQLDSIGWRNRQGVEDARNLVHYLRLTSVVSCLAIRGYEHKMKA